jgi:large subunit ribosomal protein L13
LIGFCMTAFEGLAHPYKENIVKFAGKTKVAVLPEVGKMLLEAKT